MVADLYIFIVSFSLCETLKFSSGYQTCDVQARTESGWLCGLRKVADDGSVFASFLGIPYAKQPVGELRFAELQPAEKWDYFLDATREGPVCPQYDQNYGNLVWPHRKMSDACIHANIHVPEAALPWNDPVSQYRQNSFTKAAIENDTLISSKKKSNIGLPILVFVHGGGFESGSGDTDIHGPEYLVGRGVLVFTFNYRVSVFGFLSLNTPQVPGNAGLRDMITFLRWVKRNAPYFGGNPEEVTLMGQSAGAACVHLLSLSDAARGLFKRIFLMSGTGIPSFFSASPIYAQTVANMYSSQLGINSTNSSEIYRELINMPLERIVQANQRLQFDTGTTSFVPVVEGLHPGVTRVIDDEPINLIKRGRGKEYPTIIGFTNTEAEFFRWRLQYLDLIDRIKKNSTLLLNSRLVFSTPTNLSRELGKEVGAKYFHGPPNLEDYIDIVTYNYFEYPAFKLAQWRSEIESADTFLYEFRYSSELNILKNVLTLVDYDGATHVEDLTYVFKFHRYLGDYGVLPLKDHLMKEWMSSIVYNFMICSNPTCVEGIDSPWPKVQKHKLNLQVICEPGWYQNRELTPEQLDMIKFFDGIEERARSATLSRVPAV